MSRADVPRDVWYNIINFLPEETVLAMQGVNEAFRDAARSFRYRALRIVAYDKHTKETLKDLRDPSIGSLVTSVHLQPWIEAVSEPQRHWPFRLWTSINTFLVPEATEQRKKERIKRKHRKHVARFANTLQALTQVSEYAIESDESLVYDPEIFTAFITTLLANGSSFGRNLVKLKLKLPPDKMIRMAPIRLPHLEELDFHFSTGLVRTLDIIQYAEGFVTFVNNLKDSLRRLSFLSSSASVYLDLTPIYHRLGTFPRLCSFSFVMPADGQHMSEPSVLTRFLQKHVNTLGALRLGVSSYRVHNHSGHHLSLDGHAGRMWIPNLIHALADQPMEELHSIDLVLRPLREDYLKELNQDISMLATKLDKLVLRDRDLSLREVETILRIVAVHHELKHFALRVQYLNPQLVDLLARMLPSMQVLQLSPKDIAHRDTESDGYEEILGSHQTTLDLFLQEMRGRRYDGWALRRLAIAENPVKGLTWLDAVEDVFTECVPGLEAFEEMPFNVSF